MKLCWKKEIENGNKSARYAPQTFGLLKKPVRPVTHISSPPLEQMGFRYQTIKPFRVSNGPCQLKKYWPYPVINTGKLLVIRIKQNDFLDDLELR